MHYEQTRGFSIERLIWATPLCNKELLFSLKNAYILKRENYKKTLTKSSDYPEQKGRYNNYFVLSWKQGEVFNKLQWMQVNWVGHYILLICIWMIFCRCLHFDRIKSEKSRLLVQKNQEIIKKGSKKKIGKKKKKKKERGQPGSNRWPLDLQSNALPLSYAPCTWDVPEICGGLPVKRYHVKYLSSLFGG